MKKLLIWLFMSSLVSLIYGQRPSQQVDHICSRVQSPQDIIYQPMESIDYAVNAKQITCQYTDQAQFAALDKFQLFNYLVSETNPFECVYRELFDFNSTYTPQIFNSENVIYVATNAKVLANLYNGTSNNGLYGVMSYLSIASQMSTYFNVEYSGVAWTRIRSLSKAIIANPKSLNESNLSLRINAELFNTIAAAQINGTAEYVPFVRQHLANLADNSYESVSSLYDYYYCYYFLLDVFLRFAPDNQSHINSVVPNTDMLTELKNSAINMDLNDDTFTFFDDISTFTVHAMTRYAQRSSLQPIVGPALVEITNAYPPYSVHWTSAAIGLVQNNLPFDMTEEEIIHNLTALVLPNDFQFDDGRFIISTPLSYEESKSLYDASLEVRAQFYRLLQDDNPLAEDTNDTLRVKLYGNRVDYQSFNGILFDINYPNSGGVYIEDFGTFYTYQRTPEESTYTVEELFRHEFAHYLQGRFIIPGTWAQSPFYDNNRLVWFEEGMAQFLTASTKLDGIKGLQVIKDRILSTGDFQTLTDVFNSSYSSGNPDAFYIYGSMMWSWWYDSDRSLIKQLMDNLRNSQLTQFDNVVNFLRNSSAHNNEYHSFINQQLPLQNFWITPETPFVDQAAVDFTNVSSLEVEVTNADPSVTVESVVLNGPETERKFQLSGQLNLNGTNHNLEIVIDQLNNKLDLLMATLASSSSINNFEFGTAYYTDVQTGVTPSGTFVIEGPINEGCGQPLISEMQSQGFTSFVYLFYTSNSPLEHQFRYRELGETSWTTLDQTTVNRTTITGLSSIVGYEYQMRKECSADEWSTYSDSKYFYPCPDQRDLSTVTLNFDANFHAAVSVSSSGTMSGNSEISLVAGQNVELGISFSVEEGTNFLANANNCRVKQ